MSNEPEKYWRNKSQTITIGEPVGGDHEKHVVIAQQLTHCPPRGIHKDFGPWGRMIKISGQRHIVAATKEQMDADKIPQNVRILNAEKVEVGFRNPRHLFEDVTEDYKKLAVSTVDMLGAAQYQRDLEEKAAAGEKAVKEAAQLKADKDSLAAEHAKLLQEVAALRARDAEAAASGKHRRPGS